MMEEAKMLVKKAAYQIEFVIMEIVGDHSIPTVLLSGCGPSPPPDS